MSLTIAETLAEPSQTLMQLGLETYDTDASDLIIGAFALAVYADLTYRGKTIPENVQLGLAGIAREARYLAEDLTSKYGKRELWTEVNFHSRNKGLDITAVQS